MGTRQEVGFWKPEAMRYCQDQKVQMPHSKPVFSSQLGNLLPSGALSVDWLELRPSNVTQDCDVKYHTVGDQEGTVNFSRASGEHVKSNQKSSPLSYFDVVPCIGEANKSKIKKIEPGNSLYSSMSSEVFVRKLGLSLNNVLFHESADDAVAFCHEEEEEQFGSMEEMEAQTIGNLLPDEADLFSGVIDGLEYMSDVKGGDDAEDLDLFISVGGMELEVDDMPSAGQNVSDSTCEVHSNFGSSKGSLTGTHPYGEHPSRTLFVQNLSSHVEDSELRMLFEQYGDIRNLYTACKQQGFAMISYFDVRAAMSAMRSLLDKQLRHQKLDIHYSIPKGNSLEEGIHQGAVVICDLNSSVSEDDLRHVFGIYGEIKEIREVPLKSHQKLVEFYDVRAAEAAWCALNKCNVTGKLAGTQCLIPRCLEQDEVGLSISTNDISSQSMPTFSHGGRTISCFHNGFVQGLHCVEHTNLGRLTESVVTHGGFSGLNSLPSQTSMTYSGKHFGLHKPCQSWDQLKFGDNCIPISHSRSFPDCQDNFEISLAHNCSSTVANMAGNMSSKVSGSIKGRHTGMMVSNGLPMEFNGVSGSSGNASYPVQGHHWSNSNPFPLHSSRPMAWPSSPSYSSGVNDPSAPQLPAFYEMPHEFLKNTVSPPHHLCGGSAPSRSMDFRGSSPLHPLGRASHVFSRAVGNFTEKSKIDALHSPHQMAGKNTVTPLSTSFGYPHSCGRSLSHRRNQGGSSHADKKQFELDTQCILRGEDCRTTLMIKNIPNKYTSKMLLTTIDENCRGTYDFIYLPIDFKNKCNVGYAFINLIDPLKIIPFYKAFNGKKWEKFNSEKVAALAYARIQGKSALVAHFQNSSLMNEDKRCRPILFCTDGPNAGEQEAFPMGTSVRLRAGKDQSSSTEEIDHQGSPSSSLNEENSPNRSDSSGSMKGSY